MSHNFLAIFCLVCSQRSRNDRKRKIDLLTLLAHITTVTETKAKISAQTSGDKQGNYHRRNKGVALSPVSPMTAIIA